MLDRKLLLAALLLSLSRVAAAQVPHVFTPNTPAKAAEVNENFAFLAGQGSVYWAALPDPGDVTAAALEWAAQPAHEIAVGSLQLPAGSYLVSAKIVGYGSNMTGGDLECELKNAANPAESDHSSAGMAGALTSSYAVGGGSTIGSATAFTNWGQEKVLFLQVPVTASAATSVDFACHLFGKYFDGATTVAATAHLWGARIYAIKVPSVVKQ